MPTSSRLATSENNPERRVLAAVLVLRLGDGVEATVADVAAMLGTEHDEVEPALAALEAQGLLTAHGGSIELGSPPQLKNMGLRGLAILAELIEAGVTPSGSEIGRCLGASRRTGITTLDLLEECGYTAIDPRTGVRSVLRVPPIPDSDWQALRAQARSWIGRKQAPDRRAYSAGVNAARARTLRTFVEFALDRGRPPNIREHKEAVGGTRIDANMVWFESQGYLQRVLTDGSLRLAVVPGRELIESATAETVDQLVRRRLTELIDRVARHDREGRPIEEVAARACMTSALARRLVSELAEDGAIEWFPDTDRCRSRTRQGWLLPSLTVTNVRGEVSGFSADEASELEEVELLLLAEIREAKGRAWLDDCAKQAGLTRAVAKAASRLLAHRGLIKVTGRIVEYAGFDEGHASSGAGGPAPAASRSVASESESSGSDC